MHAHQIILEQDIREDEDHSLALTRFCFIVIVIFFLNLGLLFEILK